ncbi:MAG: DUF4381 domain-containing protein [Puniceicoccaceae bacterium]
MNGPSLSELRDIVEPAAPGLWPLAPGMWLLFAVVLSTLLFLAWSMVEKRRRNAYRRAGIVLLEEVGTTYELSVLLKRVALAVFPREEVASLHGEEWVEFLGRTCSGVDLAALNTGDQAGCIETPLREAAAYWIRNHRTELDPLKERSS